MDKTRYCPECDMPLDQVDIVIRLGDFATVGKDWDYQPCEKQIIGLCHECNHELSEEKLKAAGISLKGLAFNSPESQKSNRVTNADA